MARRCPSCSALGPPGRCDACGWPLDPSTSSPATEEAPAELARPTAPKRRSRRVPILIGGVLLVGLCVGSGAYIWWSTGTGARCATDADCRARSCVLVLPDRGVCSEGCHDDASCPDGMRCGEAVRGDTMSDLDPSRGPRRMCVPTGAFLQEILRD
ncbi:MAG: hypothetical protein AB7S26_18360 [Sandaracinaceae bacterium]